MQRIVYATFEALVNGNDDRKAVVWKEGDVYNVSYYTNGQFVYSVPQSFECEFEAKQNAIGYIAGMMFDVTINPESL